MYEQCISLLRIESDLPYRFKERETFNISNGTTNFNNNYIIFSIKRSNGAFYLISDMRNYLNGFSKIISTPLFFNNTVVYLSCCPIIFLRCNCLCKSFVMAKIQVCFSPVISNKNLSMLKRAHCPGINI